MAAVLCCERQHPSQQLAFYLVQNAILVQEATSATQISLFQPPHNVCQEDWGNETERQRS